MSAPRSVADFNDAEEALRLAKEAYLRRSGWQHTSSTPGSYWMWRRKIGEVDWFVDFATAWRIQGLQETGDDPPRSYPGV